jgi:hypothetical protein
LRALLGSLVLVAFLAACGGDNGGTRRPTAATADPHYDPPHLQVTHVAENPAPGLVFIAQKGGEGKTAAR